MKTATRKDCCSYEPRVRVGMRHVLSDQPCEFAVPEPETNAVETLKGMCGDHEEPRDEASYLTSLNALLTVKRRPRTRPVERSD